MTHSIERSSAPGPRLAQEKLELQEDDRLRDERLRQLSAVAKKILRTACLATPLLVGSMYLLMRHLPPDAFPQDFWAIAVFMCFLPFLLQLGILYPLCRFTRLRCTLHPWGIQFSQPEPAVIAWRQVTAWQIEDSQDHPGHFTVGFRTQRRRHFKRITVPGTYSQTEVRAFILRYAPVPVQAK